MGFRRDGDEASRNSRRHASIVIGGNAGGGFQSDGSMVCSYHATRTYSDGRTERGYFVKKKWLADRAAFNYSPSMGWAYEHWFEWLDSEDSKES